MKPTILAIAALAAASVSTHAWSDDAGGLRADGHAPIAVMGDHMHKAGEYMFSYRFMTMNMQGNRDGTTSLDPNTIATTVPNRFASVSGQPPTLRVVPSEMTMDMHMLGFMYAPRDWVTLMAMANYVEKDMDHLTYMGGTGTTVLGSFSTQAKGFSDTSLTALVRLLERDHANAHVSLGLSLPTGSITKRGTVLTPMAMQADLRLPYAMQLGSGTYDLLPAITYFDRSDKIAWGGQVKATIRLGENNENYTLGDRFNANAWTSIQWENWVSSSVRLNWESTGTIDGIDPNIIAPVQTADPDNYGGDQLFFHAGLNFVATSGALEGHRLALEFGVPLYRDLNGPQMETDSLLTIGWQKSF